MGNSYFLYMHQVATQLDKQQQNQTSSFTKYICSINILKQFHKKIFNLPQSYFSSYFNAKMAKQSNQRLSITSYIHLYQNIFIYYFTDIGYCMGNKPNFEAIRRDVIAERDQRLERFIPVFQQILREAVITPEKVSLIISHDLTALVNSLNKREVTSTQLVAIYGLRAATIGKHLHCITEDNFEYALKKAKECDEIRAKTNKNNWTLNDKDDEEKYLPPLFGVPISIKDNIQMAGTRSTNGLTINATKIIEEDSNIVTCVKNSGMIPFVKSNVPQLCLCGDSNNFIWGRCLNPWNEKKSAGGSSGGEGAMVAAKLSPIGVGNDVLGSIRLPAAFNGIVGLLSSTGRLPLMDTISFCNSATAGQDTLKIVTGPLSPTVDGVALWMKAMTTESFYAGKHDPYIKLIPFDAKVYNETANSKRKLRIGYIENLEMIETTPGMNRGLLQTVEFLKSEGHELVEISIPFEREVICSAYYDIMAEGDLKTFQELLQGEQLIEEYSALKRISSMNLYLLKFLKFSKKKLQPRVALILDACTKISTHQYFQKIGRLYELRTEWINYWRRNNLDFVICPSFGSQATDHCFNKDCGLFAAYTFIWNVLAMTSCSLPVTISREDEQHYDSHWEDDVTEAIYKTVKTSAGLPVSVQVVGLPFSEEKVLGVAKKIEKHFQFHSKHPLPKI